MPKPKGWGNRYPDLLENGAHLSATEFLRRYETMPEVKRAELVNGIVYMASPVRLDQHGEPDSLLQGWLCNYAIATPGVRSATNSTARLSPDDVPQPDGLLRIVPECTSKALRNWSRRWPRAPRHLTPGRSLFPTAAPGFANFFCGELRTRELIGGNLKRTSTTRCR
jgi:hypothetical protein